MLFAEMIKLIHLLLYKNISFRKNVTNLKIRKVFNAN